MRCQSIRRLIFLLLVAITATFTTASDTAMRKQSQTERILVKEDTWTVIALRGLPKGVSLTVEAKSSSRIRLVLLDEKGYEAFPETENNLFEGISENNLGFNQILTRKGDYFLVLDNRNEKHDTLVVVLITATIGR